MEKIIFFILPFFVFNLFETVFFDENTPTMNLKYFLRINNNEYNIIYTNPNGKTFIMRVDTVDEKTFNVLSIGFLLGDEIDEIKYFLKLENNLDIYIFKNYLIKYNNGKGPKVYFGDEHSEIQDQIYNGNSLLVGTNKEYYIYNVGYRYDTQLYLFKEPYNEISKNLTFKNTKEFKLIGLKDYFIFIKIGDDESFTKSQVNYTYYILDLNLSIKNSLSFKYANYSEIKFSELSENNKINEFIMCISYYYKSIAECKIIACIDSDLYFSNFYQIFPGHDIDNKIYNNIFSLYINIFDEDKIGCYLLSSDPKPIYEYESEYDYVTILQYNNNHLNYYKNIRDIPISTIRRNVGFNKIEILKIYNSIYMITSNIEVYLFYLSSVYLEKTISLKPNEEQNKFPIEEFIFPGIEPLFHFSFYEIPEGLTIYKNITEIVKGQVFKDLNNFTYILKIEHYFKNFTIKIKDHEDDHIYEINTNITSDTYINTYKERHKCFKSILYDRINNINYSNLYDIFRLGNGTEYINLIFYMESEPLLNERVFYLNNYTIDCTYDLQNITTCKIPLTIIPIYEKIHVYSYLSCYNLIDVGWIQINDVNIFGAYDLYNYNFDNISKKYDPSEKIREYNPEMINYYYWFSCLAYSDNNNLGQKNYCKNILSTWRIVFNKEYSYGKTIESIIINFFNESIKLDNEKKNYNI